MKIQNISLTTLTTVLNKVKRNGILTILFLVASLSTTLVMMSFRNPHDKNTFRNVNGVDVGVELVPIFFYYFTHLFLYCGRNVRVINFYLIFGVVLARITIFGCFLTTLLKNITDYHVIFMSVLDLCIKMRILRK